MLKKSKNYNPNYLAKIVKLEGLHKHSNADKLQVVTIDFQNVITGMDAKDGDIYVYFPVECTINKEFLSWSNSFEDKTLNQDNTKKGFFNKHGRVRAIKLRGEASQGYIIPLKVLGEWLKIVTNYKSNGIEGIFGDNYNDVINQEFDSWNDIIICQKYVPKAKENNHVGLGKGKQAVKHISRLVDNQFRLHSDTENLRKNIYKINPNDFIGIHYKKHGTSFVVGNVLTKRKLSWLDKLAKLFGANIKETEYDIIYSSRKVVKNEFETKQNNHYYSEDIWGIVKNEISSCIPKGFTLYGEILGYLNSGGYIQKNYDYGCKDGEHKVYIYRITFTNEDGQVFELNDLEIKDFCNTNGLNYNDTFIWYGPAYNFYHDHNIHDGNDSLWRVDFIKHLEDLFNNKDCYMCVNKVPEEGIVVRKQSLNGYEAYKLKSARFLEYETKELDSEEVNIEDNGTESTN